ncbi:hypothetical protein HP546_12950 [Pseudomonas sp. CM25]|uniref:hypothetical protein n=1 Tax=unclassified Pseudomonas TaxID=196821 RepID=UPI001557DD38|nr:MULTISPECIES: hypothetical protein [unclassified Pseudomonas]NQD56255.1 hypothetical protein [Pseudomonas sp. CM25]NQD76172.1 hypothetical protein [Pseudomonas sp. CM27]HEN8802553.1 hypothetical protein [Pseudomonas putida]
MKKLVPDPPVTDLLLLDPPNLSLIDSLSIDDCKRLTSALTLSIEHTTTVLLGTDPGDTRNAMGMNIRVLCAVINALSEHVRQGGKR